MGISRTRLRDLSALLGGALLVSLPIAPVAAAATAGSTVTITSLSSGQTVSGTVAVDATIQPAPGAALQSVSYSIQGQSGTQTQIVPLTPGQCTSTCNVSWTWNTAAVQTYVAGGAAVPVLADGEAKVVVSANGSGGSVTSTDLVMVNNHRPTLVAAPGALVSIGYLMGVGNQSTTLRVVPTVAPTAPTGSTVSSVQLEVPGLPVANFSLSGDGSVWTANVDSSAFAPGFYSGSIVATDSNGTVSKPLRAELVIDHGFTLAAPPAPVIGPDWASTTLMYSYPPKVPGDLGSCGSEILGVVPDHVDVYLDGTLWHSADIAVKQVVPAGDGMCEIPEAGTDSSPAPLPFGHHTLSYTVTDGVGLTETTATQSVTVALPLTTSWPTAAMTVLEGSTVRLAPAVTAPDGFSTLKSWTIAFNGATLASGSYPSTPSLDWTTPAKTKVSGALTLTTTSDSGLTTQSSFPLTGVWNSATFLKASAATVAPGAWVKLTATPWEDIAGAWKDPNTIDSTVRFQWHGAGTSTWSNGSSVNISAAKPGPVGVWVRVWQNECFRAQWNYSATGVYLPSTSAAACVTVKS